MCALTLLLIVSCSVSVEDWNALFLKDSGTGSFLRLERSLQAQERGGASSTTFCA